MLHSISPQPLFHPLPNNPLHSPHPPRSPPSELPSIATLSEPRSSSSTPKIPLFLPEKPDDASEQWDELDDDWDVKAISEAASVSSRQPPRKKPRLAPSQRKPAAIKAQRLPTQTPTNVGTLTTSTLTQAAPTGRRCPLPAQQVLVTPIRPSSKHSITPTTRDVTPVSTSASHVEPLRSTPSTISANSVLHSNLRHLVSALKDLGAALHSVPRGTPSSEAQTTTSATSTNAPLGQKGENELVPVTTPPRQIAGETPNTTADAPDVEMDGEPTAVAAPLPASPPTPSPPLPCVRDGVRRGSPMWASRGHAEKRSVTNLFSSYLPQRPSPLRTSSSQSAALHSIEPAPAIEQSGPQTPVPPSSPVAIQNPVDGSISSNQTPADALTSAVHQEEVTSVDNASPLQAPIRPASGDEDSTINADQAVPSEVDCRQLEADVEMLAPVFEEKISVESTSVVNDSTQTPTQPDASQAPGPTKLGAHPRPKPKPKGSSIFIPQSFHNNANIHKAPERVGINTTSGIFPQALRQIPNPAIPVNSAGAVDLKANASGPSSPSSPLKVRIYPATSVHAQSLPHQAQRYAMGRISPTGRPAKRQRP
ncbi:hypothetical protein BD410DRAFT_797914 [Rickenella mellea]|uniref:Uncharacterized protein n=1 Tax=Rickenella mellea TaxID=50990 RepID=A0A4R5XDW8_9AGAM|nr:hypothetical protein BD410DRAFT_797914 [Rickenella mellea]